jgi:predicted nucleic acid-binding Zn ribbon protein
VSRHNPGRPPSAPAGRSAPAAAMTPDQLLVQRQGREALTNYQRRTRRAMLIYGAVLISVLGVIWLLIRLAYAHGEITKVSRAAAATPARPVPTAAPALRLSTSWQSGDRGAAGSPYSDGVVVTYNSHTVNGRDARTGQVAWHYTRTDEILCSVTQQDRSTIAIFRRRGNCDEVTGFVTSSGQPKWYRTLLDDGESSVASAPNIVLIVTDRMVHVIDNAGGEDRWTWSPPGGCRVDRALGGELGVLIGYHCGLSHRLQLHELTGDKELWNTSVNQDLAPLTADGAITVVDRASGQVSVLSAAKGTLLRQTALPADASGAIAALPRAETSLVVGVVGLPESSLIFTGRLVAVAPSGSTAWTAAADGPPSMFGALVGVAYHGGVALYSPGSGSERRVVRLNSPLTDTTRIYPVGAGLLAVGASVRMFQ